MMDHALAKRRSHKLVRRRSMPSSASMSRRRLRLLLLLFFLALTIPTAILVSHAYGQLKWEAFHQYRQLAEELSRRIDQRVAHLLAAEEARGFTDYQFLVVEGEGRANFLQRSALSTFPVKSDIPGLIGWFQIDTNGAFSTPLLPQLTIPADSYGLNKNNRKQRAALEIRIQSILSANRLVGGRPMRAAAVHKEILDETRGKSMPAQVANAPLAAIVDRALTASKTLKRDIKKDKEAEAVRSLRAAEVAASAFSEKQRTAQRNPNSARLNAKLKPAEPSAQAAFDQLSDAAEPAARRKQSLPGTLGRVDDLKLASPYAIDEEEQKGQAHAAQSRQRAPKKRSTRKEVEISAYVPPSKSEDSTAGFRSSSGSAANTIASQITPTSARTEARERDAATLTSSDAPRILTFESELDPFEISVLDSGHFVLYRKVWRDDQRYIQGALIDQKSFLSGLVEAAFEATALSRMSNLVVAWQGDVFAAFSGDAYRSRLTRSDELSGALLYRTRLSAPLASMELLFSVTRLPAGPGASVILWTAGVLAMVLSIGVWLMYRLGARQLALAQQQQDFVSAVSHELRTPITSIRMYAEMLREGWASEDKKRSYYEFIVQESERLSRLISNVLQLARMTHNDFVVQHQTIGVAPLMDGVRSKLTSQVQHAGFELRMQISDAAMSTVLLVDPDAFSQCLINLLDNALKFAASANEKVVEIGCQLDSNGELSITVRDHGPGIAHDQMKLIFTLFYRSGNELTRETIGTGIGLALVHQLMLAMHGSIDVANDKPGAIFTLRFPVHVGASAS
ncbi:MAG: signal transduction histidine kinase [Gammaproteobacteria bacterium]|jgi:signal transduction histidine kinase